MKSLSELCLGCLCQNLHRFADFPHTSVPARVRERLLHMIIDHDLLTVKNRPSITYNLLTANLQTINFYASLQLDDEFLSQMGAMRPTLEVILIEKCGKVSDHGLSELLLNQTSLKSLSFKYLTINGHCLKSLHCGSTLKSLNLKGCSAIAPEYIVCAVDNHSRISDLNLKRIRGLNCENLTAIAARLGDKLLKINISECFNIREDGLLQLAAHCGRIQEIKVAEGMNISNRALESLLLNSRLLTRLDISYCSHHNTKLTPEIFENISPTIKTLTLRGVETTASVPSFLECLSMFTHLSRLSLSGFGLLSDAFLHQLLSIIGPQLHGLDLGGSFDKITDAGLAAVAQYCTSGLADLGLNILPKLTMEGVLPLLKDKERADKIRVLRLASCTSISTTVLDAIIDNCSSLRELDISGIGKPEVNDGYIFRAVDSFSSTLEILYLRGNRAITDAAITELAIRTPNLTCLSLSGIGGITDASVIALAGHCHYLRELYVSGCTMISQASINYLQDQTLHRVSIIHLVPNAMFSDGVIAKDLDTGEFVRMGTSVSGGDPAAHPRAFGPPPGTH